MRQLWRRIVDSLIPRPETGEKPSDSGRPMAPASPRRDDPQPVPLAFWRPAAPASADGNRPATLAAERQSSGERPIVFDPALLQFTAHRAGEPRFDSAAEADAWHADRNAVMHHILTTIAHSSWSRHLVLRGSALLATWLGKQARPPGDLDWVVYPSTWRLHQAESDSMITAIMDALKGSSLNAHLAIPSGGFATEDIWTYERAPGQRIIVPWKDSELPQNGTIQMDFVFREKMACRPVEMDVRITDCPPIRLLAASREQSLAWKLLWLDSDMHPMGKDLYDAVLLAEGTSVSWDVLERTFDPVRTNWGNASSSFSRKSVLGWVVDWDEFIKEYPQVTGTAEDWLCRLANALEPLWADADRCPTT